MQERVLSIRGEPKKRQPIEGIRIQEPQLLTRPVPQKMLSKKLKRAAQIIQTLENVLNVKDMVILLLIVHIGEL